MENFVITLVCIALLILGAVTLSMAALSSLGTIADAVQVNESMSRDILNSGIRCQSSSTTGNGAIVDIDIENDGKMTLANFAAWDVIVRYQDGDTVWIPYSAGTPGWSTSGFFFQGRC